MQKIEDTKKSIQLNLLDFHHIPGSTNTSWYKLSSGESTFLSQKQVRDVTALELWSAVQNWLCEHLSAAHHILRLSLCAHWSQDMHAGHTMASTGHDKGTPDNERKCFAWDMDHFRGI